MKPKLLNLGCGSIVHEEWINVDFTAHGKGVIGHNLLKGIPFKENEFDAVYHSHVLEHFTSKEARTFIEECFRVLKPGGIIRVVVPDLEGIVREYLNWLEKSKKGENGAEYNYEWMLLELFDQMVRRSSGGDMLSCLKSRKMRNKDFIVERIGSEIFEALNKEEASRNVLKKIKHRICNIMDAFLDTRAAKHIRYYLVGRFRCSGEIHQWMYDSYSLKKLLVQAGFSDVMMMDAGSSNIKDFSIYGFDQYDGKPRGSSSIFVEAVKN